MYLIIVIIILVVFAVWCMKTATHHNWLKAQKMFGYFEYDYRGEIGSSRDYGPMLEIDMVGAIRYRQEMGATIVYEVYKSNEDDICDIIDQRQHMHQQQTQRRRG